MNERQHRAARARVHVRRERQYGLSMPSVLVILGAVFFIGMFAITIGPAYIENMTINKIVSTKAADSELMRSPRSKIYASLNSAYEMNNLRGVKAEDTVVLAKHATRGYLMTVRYEKRATLMSNIDVVTSFEKEIGE